jgi:hypothetical protein
MESFYGPSASNCAIGNGKLTAGLSKNGETVNLSWPFANYCDQLKFKTMHDNPPGWTLEKYNNRLNAGNLDGIRAGIIFTCDGKERRSFFSDNEWTKIQGYYSDNTPIVITTFSNSQYDFELKCLEFVDVELDVYLRQFILHKGNKKVANLRLFTSSAFALCNQTPEFNPEMDWRNDENNGFISYKDLQLGCTFSILPQEKTTVPITNDEFESYLKKYLKHDYNPKEKDVNLCFGTMNKLYKSLLFENDKNTSIEELLKESEEPFARNAIIKYEEIELFENIEINYCYSFSKLHELAYLNWKYALDHFEELRNKTIDYWDSKINNAQIPNYPNSSGTSSLKRILINILLAQNPVTGGIGSSIGETQPPYTMVWTRDAAVMSYLLDCSGFHVEAEKCTRFFSNTQRKLEGEQCRKPENKECYAGTWAQCYYSNGTPSWFYDFEIDEVGWGIWSWYAHATFIKNDNERKQYLESIKNNVILAADFLVKFKDTKTNLDDLLWKSQTQIGASTTVMGLKSAISMLYLLDEKDSTIQSYQTRLIELQAAIEQNFWNENTQQYEKAVYGNFGPRGIIIWPTLLYKYTNFKMDNHAKALYLQLQPFFNKSKKALNKEWWYIGKATMAMAYAWQDNQEELKKVKGYLDVLLTEVCTQDTHIYGETPMVRQKKDLKGNSIFYYDNRVGQPCNIAGAYIYLTADLLYGKSALKFDY